MSVTIQQRRDLAATWTADNPVLHQGEFGVETDTGQVKLGDGATAWTALAYWGGGGGGGGGGGLPALAEAGVSAGGTLALNKITEVTASTALTMTLPSSVADSLIVVERASASTANVAVTGNMRGGTSTITLQLGAESEMFYGDGTTWWPVAGHRTLSSLQALFGNVVAPSGDTTGATDVTNLQAALTAAVTAGRGTVKGQPGSVYWINAPLVIGAYTTLDMTGCVVNLVSGSNCNMLIDVPHNAGTLGVPSTMQNITVTGGIWDRLNSPGTGGDYNGLNTMILGGRNLNVRNVRFQSTGAVAGPKYALVVQNAEGFTVEDIFGYQYISAIIKIQGPCSFGLIRNIYAFQCKDDMICVSPTEWNTMQYGNEGDVSDITIDGVFGDPQQVAHCVGLFSGKTGTTGAGTVLNLWRIKIRNIHGFVNTAALNPVYIGESSQYPMAGGNIDDIIVDGIDCYVQNAAQSVVNINSMSTPANSIGVGSVTLRNITVRSDCNAVVSNYTPLANLVIEGVTGATTANPFGAGLVNQVGALASIGVLKISNVTFTSAGTQGGSLINSVTSGQALTEAFLNNVWCSNVAYLASLITTTKLNLSNVHMLGNAGVINSSTGAVVTLATTGTCNLAVPTSAGTGTTSPFGNLNVVIDTGVAGYALINGTGAVPGTTWTAPADGRLHSMFCLAYKYVTTTEVGGAVSLNINTSQAILKTIPIFTGGTAGPGITGDPGGDILGYLVEPGESVYVSQTSALTSGASTIYVQIWAA